MMPFSSKGFFDLHRSHQAAGTALFLALALGLDVESYTGGFGKRLIDATVLHRGAFYCHC